MEILLLGLLAVLVGWWFFTRNTQSKSFDSTSVAAPYKIETPPVNNKTGDVVEDVKPAWHTAPPEDTKPVTVESVLDVNKDGKVNLEDVKEAVKKTRARAKKAADVDGDGKVTKADAKAAGKKVKEKATKKVAVIKAKTTRSKKA